MFVLKYKTLTENIKKTFSCTLFPFKFMDFSEHFPVVYRYDIHLEYRIHLPIYIIQERIPEIKSNG